MARIRRVDGSDRDRNTLSVYVVRDNAGDEYLGRDKYWVGDFADARVFKRLSDAMNSLGYHTYERLKERELRILKLSVTAGEAQPIEIQVSEDYYEKYAREKREKDERERQQQTTVQGGSLPQRW